MAQEAAAVKALELDDNLAQAHTSLAAISAWFDRNWPIAQREFQRAIELNPSYALAHHWYGHIYLAAVGDHDAAVRELQRAHELDPLSLMITVDLGFTLYLAQRYDEAIQQYQVAHDLQPKFAYPHFRLWQAYHQKGLLSEALREWVEDLKLTGDQVLARRLEESFAEAGYK